MRAVATTAWASLSLASVRLLVLEFLGVAMLIYSALMLVADVAVVPLTTSLRWDWLEYTEQWLVGSCHRMPSRSIWIAAVPMGLCARCSGVYLGAAMVLLVGLRAGDRTVLPPRVAIVLILSLLLDGMLQHLLLYDSGNGWRLFTGFLYGAGVAGLLQYILARQYALVLPIISMEKLR